MNGSFSIENITGHNLDFFSLALTYNKRISFPDNRPFNMAKLRLWGDIARSLAKVTALLQNTSAIDTKQQAILPIVENAHRQLLKIGSINAVALADQIEGRSNFTQNEREKMVSTLRRILYEIDNMPANKAMASSKDHSAIANPTGGIDLTPANIHLQTQNNGGEIKFHLDLLCLSNYKMPQALCR